MNKEEIKHFKSLLRQGSLRHMNILLDDKFQKELQTIIEDYEKLQQETEKLKKQYCERTDCGGRIGNSKKVEELQNENKQMKDNWNKLKVWLANEIIYCKHTTHWDVRDKIEELERGVSDVEDIFDEINEILQKYREIIGVSDEKKSI